MAADTDDDVFNAARDDYLAPILAEIRRRATEEAGGEALRAAHAYRAFDEYFRALAPRRRSFGEWLQDNVFLVLAVFLTFAFGLFGLYHPDDGDVAGFLDIAKIFAGAVVGGAAGSSLARTRQEGASSSQ
ncbi:MAG TPA: hypothetical protein VF702_07235 [Allosphingosinicella sp.]|jgi:hypothetical protein